MRKILIITGGTGGHVIPAINFYNHLNNNKSNKVFLFTDKRGHQYIEDKDKIKTFRIQSSHLSGSIIFKIKGFFKLMIGFFQSIIILLILRPKTIISFGSYASLPPLVCFLLLRYFFKIELFIHEQNSIVGQTNKFFVKYANKIFVNFDREYPSINNHKDKIFVAGFPQKNLKKYNFNQPKKNQKYINFLVFAGSQGSLDVLFYFTKLIKELKKISFHKEINFIIQCPVNMQSEIRNLLNEHNYKYEIESFFDNFDKILSKTNIALCRSGAGTINDLIYYKIPAIILPLPQAKDNHQFENAKILTEIDCAMISNKNLIQFNKIISFIRNVVDDKVFNKSLIDKLSKLVIYDANELMLKNIINDKKK